MLNSGRNRKQQSSGCDATRDEQAGQQQQLKQVQTRARVRSVSSRNNPARQQDSIGATATHRKSADSSAIEPASKRTRVVVIGAGLAGLAAAQRLYESNVRDVIVLDAQDRVGGRVHTVNHSDYLIEIGAQWLHGADQNPLYQWLLNKEMLDDFEDASLGFRGLFCTSQGEEIDIKLVKYVIDILCECKYLLSKNRLADLIHDARDGRNKFKNASQVFRSFLDERIRCEDQLRCNIELVDSIFEWFLRYETIENGCNNMDEVSISSYTDWTDWGDGTLLNFKNGYKCLLDWFCSQFPAKDWIHLGTPVLNVEILRQSTHQHQSVWLDEHHNRYFSPVLVRYGSKGDKRVGLIQCDHVITTASLGFLKQNYDTFFKPKLPESKINLIRSIGFGTVNKIILQFEKPFWSKCRSVKLVHRCQNDIRFRDGSLPDWSRDILSFDVVRRQPNLLIGWIGGAGAISMERFSNEEVGRVCMQLFEFFLPEAYPKPSRLIKCICSRWNSNRYVCGSYSFQSVDSFHMNTDKLQEPLYAAATSNLDATQNNNTTLTTVATSNATTGRIPRVLFAGEATAGKLYSTTHGAIITGWREADRLVDHLSFENNIKPTQSHHLTGVIEKDDAAAISSKLCIAADEMDSASPEIGHQSILAGY